MKWIAVLLALSVPAMAQDATRADLDRIVAKYPDAYADLLRQADEAVRSGPFSVTDKTSVPPSGDKHDYFSLSPYHWPNEKTEDGTPYVFRDGQKNPQGDSEDFDRVRYGVFYDTVMWLSMAYRFSEEDRFAAHASHLMRV